MNEYWGRDDYAPSGPECWLRDRNLSIQMFGMVDKEPNLLSIEQVAALSNMRETRRLVQNQFNLRY